MTPEIEAQAREMLAAEYAKELFESDNRPRLIRDLPLDHLSAIQMAALRAIATALLETASVERENARAVAIINRYARHDGLCGIVGGYDRCTCGLEEARAALRSTLEEEKAGG